MFTASRKSLEELVCGTASVLTLCGLKTPGSAMGSVDFHARQGLSLPFACGRRQVVYADIDASQHEHDHLLPEKRASLTTQRQRPEKQPARCRGTVSRKVKTTLFLAHWYSSHPRRSAVIFRIEVSCTFRDKATRCSPSHDRIGLISGPLVSPRHLGSTPHPRVLTQRNDMRTRSAPDR
jgi:hypothetical protein